MLRLLCCNLIAAFLLASCSNEEMVNGQSSMVNDSITLTLHFTRFEIERVPMSRATDVSEYINHLDIWLSDGKTTTDYHQTTDNDGFGALTLTLNKNTTYTMYAVAHRVNGYAQLSDGIISFPDDKITHSFFFSKTFKPTADMSSICPMNRIVAMLHFAPEEPIPTNIKQMRFTINGIYNRWNVAGYGVNMIDRTSTITISSTNADGTATFSVYAIVKDDEETLHDVLIEALDASGNVRKSRTIENVPLKNSTKTIIRGPFFEDDTQACIFSFQAYDWAEGQTINL